MFVNGAFPDIAPARKRDIHRTESVEKRCQEKDGCSDFLHKFSIHILEGDSSHIHREGISREVYDYSETLDNLQKRKYIPDSRNIKKRHLLKEQARSDDGKTGILRSADLDRSGKCLSSGDFEHNFMKKIYGNLKIFDFSLFLLKQERYCQEFNIGIFLCQSKTGINREIRKFRVGEREYLAHLFCSFREVRGNKNSDMIENFHEIQENISKFLRVILDSPWFFFIEIFIGEIDKIADDNITGTEIESLKGMYISFVRGNNICFYSTI